MPLAIHTLEKIYRDGTYDESLPFTFDFSEWDLLTDDEQIVSAVATSDGTGLTVGTVTVSADDKQVSVQLSGGIAGATYTVFCKATTTSGYTPIGVGYLRVLNPPSVAE